MSKITNQQQRAIWELEAKLSVVNAITNELLEDGVIQSDQVYKIYTGIKQIKDVVRLIGLT